MRRPVVMTLLLAVASSLLSVVLAAPASAALPTPIAASTARSYLSQLTVATEDRTGYDRDLFPHWSTVSGACDTRETVLARDGSGVVQSSACAATSGSWYSQYDGVTITVSSSIDIDHMIPLAEAWDSGASAWTTARRQSFANDLSNPQLIAVSASSNRSKGDQDPAEWTPTRDAYDCTYVRAWVDVKHAWDLSVDPTEKAALQDQLSGC